MHHPAIGLDAPTRGGLCEAPARGEPHAANAENLRTRGLVTRRTAQILIALVALAATGAVIWARHPRGGDELYEQAISAYDGCQYADAARLFERLATEYPTHPRASDSLCQLGYVERSFLNNPEAALAAFSRVAGQPGKSEWKLQALKQIGYIQRSLQNYDEAVRAYESLEFQFADDLRTSTDARLELAQTYVEMGDAPQARASCQKVFESEGVARADTIRALRLLARVSDKLEGDSNAAVDALTQIIRLYPNTADADQAQRDLAYIRSQMSVPASAKPKPDGAGAGGAGARPSSQALLVDLPQDIPGGAHEEGLLECLHVLCAAQGTVLSEDKLATLTGQAFAFWYGTRDRLRGDRVYTDDPVELAGKRLGLTGVQKLTARSEAEAMTLLKGKINGKLAVLVPLTLGGRPTWRIVTGYDPAQSQFLLFAETGRYVAVDAAEFKAAWTNPAAPAIRVGGAQPAKYTMYVVAPGRKTTDGVSGAKTSFQSAVEILRGSSAGNYVSGAKAFRLLADDFAKASDGTLQDADVSELTSWCGRPLSDLSARRAAAKKQIDTWTPLLFRSTAAQEQASRASELLGDSIELLSRISGAYARARDGSGPIEGGGSPSDLATKLADIDEQIADALDRAL
jgi:FimV-like protein